MASVSSISRSVALPEAAKSFSGRHALVVGADILGKIPDALAEFGIDILQHLSGRNVAHSRKAPALPRNADMVVLLTDFLGHNVMRHYRELAQESNIPVIACRRSVCAIRQSLTIKSQC